MIKDQKGEMKKSDGKIGELLPGVLARKQTLLSRESLFTCKGVQIGVWYSLVDSLKSRSGAVYAKMRTK
jgi:hypothetical protein